LRARGDGQFAAHLPELRATARAGVVMETVCPETDHVIGDFDYEDYMINRLDQAVGLAEEVERELGLDSSGCARTCST
jgi:hypothetical protein